MSMPVRLHSDCWDWHRDCSAPQLQALLPSVDLMDALLLLVGAGGGDFGYTAPPDAIGVGDDMGSKASGGAAGLQST